MAYYVHKITVEGAGQFPIDMLRYDQAFPASEADSAIISQQADQRVVNLERISGVNIPAGATLGRWASFGWRVVSCTVDRMR